MPIFVKVQTPEITYLKKGSFVLPIETTIIKALSQNSDTFVYTPYHWFLGMVALQLQLVEDTAYIANYIV